MNRSNFITKLKNLFRRRYVIVDASDNSVTISKSVYKSMDIKDNIVFVFRVEDSFGFAVDPPLDGETQTTQIQYNEKHKTIGFETLCPSVNLMLHELNLPPGVYKFGVDVRTTKGMKFYKILRP